MNPNYRRTRHARELMAADPSLKYTEALRLADKHHADADATAITKAAVTLWNGQHHSDPLTFLVGPRVDDPTRMAHLTLGGSASHYLIAGAAGRGKTAFVDVLIAQVAIKTMPWGENIFGHAHVIDPMGQLAERWRDRPNVTVTNGSRDAVDDQRAAVGIKAVAHHLGDINTAMLARRALLDEHKVSTWNKLPDQVKVEHRLAPVLVVIDETWFITKLDPSPTSETAIENTLRKRALDVLLGLARIGRASGFHVIAASQSLAATSLDRDLLQNLAGRVMLGEMGPAQTRILFGHRIADQLTALLPEDRRSPGLARTRSGESDDVVAARTFHVGAGPNPEVLDRLLPRQSREPAVAPAVASNYAELRAFADAQDRGTPAVTVGRYGKVQYWLDELGKETSVIGHPGGYWPVRTERLRPVIPAGKADPGQCICNEWQYCQRSPMHKREMGRGYESTQQCPWCTPANGVRYAGQCPFDGDKVG